MASPASPTAAPGGVSHWSPQAGPPASECAWCAGPLGSSARRSVGRIWCPRCGVATTSPSPTDAELEAAYGDWYRPESGRFAGAGDMLLRRTRSTLARRIDQSAPAGAVLDVGAGDGTLVAALRARGRDAVGLERHATGPHLRDQELADVTGTWAAIVFWHSLEHLRRPATALADAARLLAPGGLLVVAMPNAASRQATRFGDRWFALDLPRHLVHVPTAALRARLDELGFRIDRVSQLRGGQVVFGWAHGLVDRLPGHPSLYDAIRSPAARSAPMRPGRRAATLAAGALVTPVAVLAAAGEAVGRNAGSIYLEARR